MRLALPILIALTLFSCKARLDSDLKDATGRPAPLSSASDKFSAHAKWENDTLTFVRTKSFSELLNLSVVRFAKQDGNSFDMYGRKITYPANKSKCVIPGKDYTCDRDMKNPDFGDRINFGPALRFVRKTQTQSVYEGTWPCGKVIEFISEMANGNKKQCQVTAKVKPGTKKVIMSVKVVGGLGLAGNGVDLEALPLPFVDQPLQKEVVLAAMKRIRERWPDNAIQQLGANPPNIDMGTKENTSHSTIVSCNENLVPWWSDIVVHYYCQFPGMGIRDCFTGSVRGGYDYNYRPYFTPIPGYEGSSMGGAYDYCLHDGAKKKKTPFYRRFADPTKIPDDGTRGNYKWLAVTPVLDDSGQPFLDSTGKPITHGEVFEYIMGSGVAMGSHPDLADQFDKMSGDLGSKLFTVDAVWREYAKKEKEVVGLKDAMNQSASWTDTDDATCGTNKTKLNSLRGWGPCRNPSSKSACEAVPGCSWDECASGTVVGICIQEQENLCPFISTKAVCEASSECVISSAGKCDTLAAGGSDKIKDLKKEMTEMIDVTKKINADIEKLKSQLKPIREKMHFNDNFSTVSTFNNDDQQWVINKFYNLADGADQKVCEPNMNGDKVSGYKDPPDGTCCADTRFVRISSQEGRTAKVRFQRNLSDERGQRDNNCEKDAQGACLVGGVNGGSTKFANVCKSAPLPPGVVIANPEN